MNISKNTTYKDLWVSDFDKDGIPNIDDTRPANKKIKRRVNKEVSLSEKWEKLKGREKSYRKDIKELSEKVGAKKGRVKRTYSTIGKQMGRYIVNIKDMGGLRVLTDNKKENNQVLNHIEKTFKKCKKDTDKNCIFEIENKYTNKSRVFIPKSTRKDDLPYLGYHIGLNYKGKPYEIQIKCKEMQKIQDKTHPYFKAENEYLLRKKFTPLILRLKKDGC